jgi:hypothetical protein
MIRKSKCLKGIAVAVMFLVFFFCAASVELHSGECERAFMRCTQDPYWQAVAHGIVYCLTGYAFCKKYIEG